MKISTPDAKAVRSALVGLAAGALVVGGVLYGGTLAGALQGEGLQASQSARAGFAVAAPATAQVLLTPRGARPATTTTTTTTIPVTYRVAEHEADDQAHDDRESEED